MPSPILKPFADASGFVDVNKHTLQSKKFSNVFALGDCSNSPNSKTAAAVAHQNAVLANNLQSVMKKEKPTKTYQGYASCPLVTSYDRVIMAEFDYDLKPLETFPVDQGKERKSMFLVKKFILPWLYWNMLLKYTISS